MSSWGAANVCAAGCGSAMKALSLSATDCEIADLIAALLQRHALPRPPSRSTFRRNGTRAVLRGKMLASAGSIVGGGWQSVCEIDDRVLVATDACSSLPT